MQTDEPGAIAIPNNNYFPNREGHTPRYVIIHGTAGNTSAQSVAQFFQSTEGSNGPVSSHYIIGVDGTVVQCVSEKDGAWANGVITGPPGISGDTIHHDPWWDSGINPNDLTISIEHCKAHDDNSDLVTGAQMAASFMLVKHICQRHNIPMRAADAQGGITGHYSIDPVDKSRCPGPYPWAALWDYLQEGDTMIPAGWKDDGTTLTAPNGVPVVRGFRDRVLNGWDANNLPLQAEQPMNPLELSNPGLGGGTQQVFRWTVLEWNADRGVFVSWVGQELLAYRKALHDAQTQIASLSQGETAALLKRVADDTSRFNQIGSDLNQIGSLLNEIVQVISDAAQRAKVAQA
jgi:N-acetyl-anhydromuramyl-L-alanine amidase AmpD